MTKTKSKTSEKRQNKGHHIDVRFTEEEYNQIITNANKCGMHKSNYIHNAVLGHQPKQLMTEGQEEALKSFRRKVRTCRHPQCPSRTTSGGEEAVLQKRANHDRMDRGCELPHPALGHHQGKLWRIGL